MTSVPYPLYTASVNSRHVKTSPYTCSMGYKTSHSILGSHLGIISTVTSFSPTYFMMNPPFLSPGPNQWSCGGGGGGLWRRLGCPSVCRHFRFRSISRKHVCVWFLSYCTHTSPRGVGKDVHFGVVTFHPLFTYICLLFLSKSPKIALYRI